ncbi:hypothetical protein VDGL01_09572 [Verticillium dahliae]|nr:hypothetical protein VD0003_g6990 [Verticillium dahliae]
MRLKIWNWKFGVVLALMAVSGNGPQSYLGQSVATTRKKCNSIAFFAESSLRA